MEPFVHGVVLAEDGTVGHHRQTDMLDCLLGGAAGCRTLLHFELVFNLFWRFRFSQLKLAILYNINVLNWLVLDIDLLIQQIGLLLK